MDKTPKKSKVKEETKKVELTTKTVSMDDFKEGFIKCRIGAESFIDSKFRAEIYRIYTEEYKLPKETKMDSMLLLYKRLNVCLLDLYLGKVQEILSLPEGVSVEVLVEALKDTDLSTEKPKEKKEDDKEKEKPAKTKEKPEPRKTVTFTEPECDSCGA